MTIMGRILHTLRAWTGLADAAESRLTPDHGWLLPAPVDARANRKESDARRVARELHSRA